MMRQARWMINVMLIATIGPFNACAPKNEDSHVAAGRKAGHRDKTPNQDNPANGQVPSDDKVPENPEARLVQYQPGIRIDYRMPQVEIDAEVILRMGELELFAYCKAPTPKEHETILKMSVKAEHVFQALGLIGLKPGNPVMYDWETAKITPASGDPVDVFVKYEEDGRSIEQSAWEWMHDLERDAVMSPTHWLFTGSRRDEKGRFAADVEGTLVTVVNFDTALLSLPDSHSDSDGDLWVAARTEAIPPVGTKVVLILRPALGSTPTERIKN